MNTPYKTFYQLFGMLKSWIPWRSEPVNLSRDFWMPDQSCRVCYECDSQFTILNRRHHCRQCGRVFCASCTANYVPAPSGDPRRTPDEQERVRVCNYCYKQWKQGLTTLENDIWVSKHGFSTAPSSISLVSTRSSGTHRSSSITIGSVPYSIGKYQQVHYSSTNRYGISANRLSLLSFILFSSNLIQNVMLYKYVFFLLLELNKEIAINYKR